MGPGLSARIKRDAARIINRGLLNTLPVTVSWEKPVAGSPPQDPALEATAPVTETITATHPALVHFVDPTRSIARQFTKVETGDVIIDFLAEVDLPKDGVSFIIDGERYVQKDAGKELSEFWDLMIEGQRHFRTVLATKAPGSRRG